MGHYFCVAITDEPNFNSVCNLLDDFVFDNDAEESDGIFDYYTIGQHSDDRAAVKQGSVGYVVSQDKTDFIISVDKCDCAKASDIDFSYTDFGVPYLCFMPDGSYWYWECADEQNKKEWKEVINEAIKNGWYLTVADCHI